MHPLPAPQQASSRGLTGPIRPLVALGGLKGRWRAVRASVLLYQMTVTLDCQGEETVKAERRGGDFISSPQGRSGVAGMSSYEPRVKPLCPLQRHASRM